jgi:hypothetical protein
MITFESEEDAAAAFKIADSPIVATLAVEISKDNQGPNRGGTEDLVTSGDSQGKLDSRKSLFNSKAHQAKSSQ